MAAAIVVPYGEELYRCVAVTRLIPNGASSYLVPDGHCEQLGPDQHPADLAFADPPGHID